MDDWNRLGNFIGYGFVIAAQTGALLGVLAIFLVMFCIIGKSLTTIEKPMEEINTVEFMPSPKQFDPNYDPFK